MRIYVRISIKAEALLALCNINCKNGGEGCLEGGLGGVTLKLSISHIKCLSEMRYWPLTTNLKGESGH